MNHDALTRHYDLLLGLARPWHVQSVDHRFEAMEVCVRVERSPDVPLQCPDCGEECLGPRQPAKPMTARRTMETPHMNYHVGMDYHKAYTTVCMRDDADAIVLEGEVRPTRKEGVLSLFQHLGEDAKVRVVFECGLNRGYLFDLLKELPIVTVVILANAGQTKFIAMAQPQPPWRPGGSAGPAVLR